MNYDRELKYRKAFVIWSLANPKKNINDILKKEEVIVDGEEVKIGARIHNMRESLKGNAKGKLNEEQYKYWVVDCGLSVDNKDDKARKSKEGKYREALEIWLKDNEDKNVNDVSASTEVKISSGEVIKLGIRIKSLKAIFLGNRSGKITLEQYNYWIDKQGLLAGYDICYDKDTGKITKTKREIDRTISTGIVKKERKASKKDKVDTSNIKSYFDVNEERQGRYSNLRRKRQQQSNEIMKIGDESLRNYCARVGYNYDVVYRKIRKLMEYGYSREEAMITGINSYKKQGTSQVNNHVYTWNGYPAKYLFLYLGLGGEAILDDMNNYDISFETAIRHNIFKINVLKKSDKWLEELYNKLVNTIDIEKSESEIQRDITIQFYGLVEYFDLSDRDYNILWNVFDRYFTTIKNYLFLDVGLTEESELRDMKIKMYNLSDEDLEISKKMAKEFKSQFGFDVKKGSR